MSERLTAYMIDDCLHDPVLGAKVLLGYTVPPHMEMRLWGMWNYKFVIDSSGFGSGKSLTIALCAAMRAMLMEERTEGIVSRTFAQGQETHRYIDKWIEKHPIFADQVEPGNDGKPATLHGSNAWETKFKNGSRIRTIPPDFKGGAERAGSEDFTDGYFDEWTKYPNYNAFVRQLVSRVRKPVAPCYDSKDPIFARHFYFAGTAKYQWHPCFKRVQHYAEKIMSGSKIHELQAWNYLDVPERYHHLFEMDGIHEMEESLPQDLVNQEILGLWVKDSQGYYNSAHINEARKSTCPVLLERE